MAMGFSAWRFGASHWEPWRLGSGFSIRAEESENDPDYCQGEASGVNNVASHLREEAAHRSILSELHPLDLVRLDELAPAIVELGRPGRGMAGDRRGALERPAV